MIPTATLPTIEALPRLPRLVALALYALADEWGEIGSPLRRSLALLELTGDEFRAGVLALEERGLLKTEHDGKRYVVTLLEWVPPTERTRFARSA